MAREHTHLSLIRPEFRPPKIYAEPLHNLLTLYKHTNTYIRTRTFDGHVHEEAYLHLLDELRKDPELMAFMVKYKTKVVAATKKHPERANMDETRLSNAYHSPYGYLGDSELIREVFETEKSSSGGGYRGPLSEEARILKLRFLTEEANKRSIAVANKTKPTEKEMSDANLRKHIEMKRNQLDTYTAIGSTRAGEIAAELEGFEKQAQSRGIRPTKTSPTPKKTYKRPEPESPDVGEAAQLREEISKLEGSLAPLERDSPIWDLIHDRIEGKKLRLKALEPDERH